MPLTDVTLMADEFRDKPPSLLRRLYEALLNVGVLVQIPCGMASLLQGSLDPSRTVIALACGESAGPDYAGYLCAEDAFAPAIRECTLDTQTLPAADAYRLTADSSLFFSNYTEQFSRFIRRASKPVSLCARGGTSLSTALTVDWLLCHSPHAVVSLMGAGGHASLAEVVMVLFLHGAGVVYPKALGAACRAFTALTGRELPPHQPVVGSSIFHVSSGVHVNGIMKDSLSYEPFPPESVGAARRILLSRHSGTSAITARLDALGYSREGVDIKRLLSYVRSTGEAKGEVTDGDLVLLLDMVKREVSV